MIRSNPESYDAWNAPLWNFTSVLDSFRAIESDRDFDGPYHGADGPVPVERPRSEDWWPYQQAAAAAMRQLGFDEKPDINSPSGSGFGAIPRNAVEGVRISAWSAILEPVLWRQNLEVRSGSPVLRIVVEKGRATGVVVADRAGPTTIEAGEVILCAGAIESPHLLYRSGIGPADELRERSIPVVADVAGIGKNLQDHPLVVMPASVPRATEATPAGMPHAHMLCYTAAGSPRRNDMQIEASYAAPPTPGAGAGESETVLLEIGLELPDGRGELRFDRTDPERPPTIVFGYMEEEADRGRLVEAVRIAADILAAPSCRELGVTPDSSSPGREADDHEIEAWLEANVATAYHGYGTCAMSPDRGSDGVVDERCRVRSVPNLRVADLSIVPGSISNANATALMIGHHAAGLILDER
jgi:choline dehydrogenase-like flavoprotein